MAWGALRQAEFDRLEVFWRQRAGGAAPPEETAPLGNDESGHRQNDCPELDCVAGRLPSAVITAAAERSRTVGTGADRVLIASGAIGEDDYVRALAGALAVPFDNLDGTRRDQCPLTDSQLIGAAVTGIVALSVAGETIYVIAPRGLAARRLNELSVTRPLLFRRIRLTTSKDLAEFITRHTEASIGNIATEQLRAMLPSMSAAPPRWRKASWVETAIGAAAFAGVLVEPRVAMIAVEALLATVFVAWIVLRLVGVTIRRPARTRRPRIPDHELPVYTVMVALYREASSVRNLVAGIRNLDYPVEKLDIKFVVEADDEETRAALAEARLDAPFEVIVAPRNGPRTKPKALNAALPFARGTFLVIYDAEDQPEPGQLRRALDVFMAGDDSLACVQASLTIDNTADNWLSALFTVEYAGQFDVFLPALAALQVPLPLGGSSNHFRCLR